ncbi:hypothetical protein ABZ814_22700 [Micromonospora musae]|uniref:hypothetical protein n=1 Tax=Micromonospora musae TaxID=1894970 RepID=UPI003400CBAD
MTSTTPSAGGILAAADALQGPQHTFNREQVAFLIRLAYDAGRTAEYVGDLAAMHANFAAKNWGRTHEQWVADQIAEMEAAAARQPWNTWRGQYPGGPVDFETGRPVRHLEVAA